MACPRSHGQAVEDPGPWLQSRCQGPGGQLGRGKAENFCLGSWLGMGLASLPSDVSHARTGQALPMQSSGCRRGGPAAV